MPTEEELNTLIERQRHNEAAINALCEEVDELRKIAGKLEMNFQILMGRI